MRKRALIGAALSVLVAAAPFSQASASTGQSSTGVINWGNVSVGGTLWRRAPILTYQGTNFFGIWYLQQLFKQRGIQSTWDGSKRSLSFDWLPTYNANASVTLDGKVIPGAHTLSVGGSVYVDVTAIAKALGWPLSYNVMTKTLTIHHNVSALNRPHQVRIEQRRMPTPLAKVPVKEAWGPVVGWRTVPIVQAQGTSFFGIWYLMQFLKEHGYQAQWHNGTVNFSALPLVVSDGNFAVGDNEGPSALISYQGHWYVPTSTLFLGAFITAGVDAKGNVTANSHLGTHQPPQDTGSNNSVKLSVDGTVQAAPGDDLNGAKVAILDAYGQTNEFDVTADGHFHAEVTGPTATLIAVYTQSGGWVGKAVPITASGAGQSGNSVVIANPVTVTTAEENSSVKGQIIPADSSENVGNTTVVLRNDITHAHIQVKTNATGQFQVNLPAGPYEVWTVALNGTPVFTGQRFNAGPNGADVSVKLAKLPTSSVYETDTMRVEASSKDVTPLELMSIGNMFSRVYQYDVRGLGLTPQLPIVIQVYGNTKDYTQHFRDEGYSDSDATNYGMSSQAVAESSQLLAVNLDGLDEEFGVNVLAHEFTHALIYTVSDGIPDWVNEGIAWHQGIGAQMDISPDHLLLHSLQLNVWGEILDHKNKGDLYPLGKADSLDPKYNVEAQDYYAVEKLIGQYGLPKVIDYVRKIDTVGDETAFSSAFGMTEDTFAKQVDTALANDVSHPDKGFRITVRVLPGGPDTLLVSNPKGLTTFYHDAAPGVYTFVCNPDGTVVAPRGLTQGGTTSDAADGNWYVGANYGDSQGLFVVSNTYGQAYIEDSVLFDENNDMDVGITTGIPIGLQVLSINPLG